MSHIICLALASHMIDVNGFFAPFERSAMARKMASLWPNQTRNQAIDWEARIHNVRKNWLTGQYKNMPFVDHPEWLAWISSANPACLSSQHMMAVRRVAPDMMLHAYFPNAFHSLIGDILSQTGSAWLLGTPASQKTAGGMPGFEKILHMSAPNDERSAGDVEEELRASLSAESAVRMNASELRKHEQVMLEAAGAWECAECVSVDECEANHLWQTYTETLVVFCRDKKIAPLELPRKLLMDCDDMTIVSNNTNSRFYRFRKTGIRAVADEPGLQQLDGCMTSRERRIGEAQYVDGLTGTGECAGPDGPGAYSFKQGGTLEECLSGTGTWTTSAKNLRDLCRVMQVFPLKAVRHALSRRTEGRVFTSRTGRFFRFRPGGVNNAPTHPREEVEVPRASPPGGDWDVRVPRPDGDALVAVPNFEQPALSAPGLELPVACPDDRSGAEVCKCDVVTLSSETGQREPYQELPYKKAPGGVLGWLGGVRIRRGYVGTVVQPGKLQGID